MIRESAGPYLKPGTLIEHRRAIERAVQTMRVYFAEELTLCDMAKAAIMSPYHFSRTFHRLTGVPPRLFLSALRLQAAKRLLLTSRASVTDVCFEVGYSSLGTFIRRFTEITGFSPVGIRSASRALAIGLMRDAPSRDTDRGAVAVRGEVLVPPDFQGPVFVGAFGSCAPITPPLAYTVVHSGGKFEVRGVPDGRYYVLAAALQPASDPIECLLCESALRAAGQGVSVRGGLDSGEIRLALRAPQPLDVPMVLTLPMLMVERSAATAGVAAAPPQAVPAAAAKYAGT